MTGNTWTQIGPSAGHTYSRQSQKRVTHGVQLAYVRVEHHQVDVAVFPRRGEAVQFLGPTAKHRDCEPCREQVRDD